MRSFATYIIKLSGARPDIYEAVSCMCDVICDQGSILAELLDKYSCSDDWDDEDDISSQTMCEEEIEIWKTHDCVWIEDIEKLALDIAVNAPNLHFSFFGHIEDCADDAGDEMDFNISYKSKELFSQTTDWYWHIHMEDFRNYTDFSAKISDQYGNPRYTREDYEGFLQTADEWYVLDSGMGEFSTNAPMGDPVRIKIKFKR